MAFVVDVAFSPAGLLGALGAFGLSRGRRVGWGVSLAAGIAGSLCFCLPCGALIIASMAHPKVRGVFRGDP
jgi:hypothetical protein